MKIRVGMEGGRKPVLARARAIGAPILVSANSLWNNERKRFYGWKAYDGFDLALDSGGFVAMKIYGGYRWTIRDYVGLAGMMRPTWWAQMDFCCEPEIAADSAAVWQRIGMTVDHLQECQRVADGEGVTMPLPVLQGWHPDDYCRGPIYEEDFRWPSLVGVGSVCRRQVYGPSGVLAVVERLHEALPSKVKLHLFGVKSQAFEQVVKYFPERVSSMDSMAWNMRCRIVAREEKVSCDGNLRAKYMEEWYRKQVNRISNVQPI